MKPDEENILYMIMYRHYWEMYMRMRGMFYSVEIGERGVHLTYLSVSLRYPCQFSGYSAAS